MAGGTSKTDQMRKAREERFARLKEEQEAREKRAKAAEHERLASATKKALNSTTVPPSSPDVSAPSKVAKAAEAIAKAGKRELGPDEAICPGCGKVRAVRNGRIAMHQKGLGKKCPGAGEEV